MPNMGRHDNDRVEDFLGKYKKMTLEFRTASRAEELDRRIRVAQLTLADKIEAVKRLVPRNDATDFREELRLERLICSLKSDELPAFKFALDYDGDYKDLEEYVFHDIDDEDSQQRIVRHFRTEASPEPIGIKILTDVDDTIYANLVDARYPRKTFYPGVLELYDAIKQEPFEVDWIPVTTLSARPNPIAGTLEEGSLQALTEHTKGRLRPSALSGRVKSSVLGTIETLSRAKRDEARSNPQDWGQRILGVFAGLLPDFEHLEERIGEVKFNNFRRFAKVYPEYRFVFFGDSGQADSLTAELMVTEEELSLKVVTTFIHDLGAASSPTFKKLDQNLVTAEPPRVILFRNHIQAAVRAHKHVSGLVTPEALARVTDAALREFRTIAFEDQDAKDELKAEYKQDARETLRLLEAIPGEGHRNAVEAIRDLSF